MPYSMKFAYSHLKYLISPSKVGVNPRIGARNTWDWTMAGDATFNVVFVLGRPGSGKGTQCAKIVEEFKWGHFSTGSLLRREVRKGTEMGAEIRGIMLSGNPVPSDKTVDVLFRAMERKAQVTKNFLIDGFPMNEENLVKWREFMTPKLASKDGVNFVLYLDLPESSCEERVVERGKRGSGRADDNVRTIRHRLSIYNSMSKPIVDLFKQKGLVKSVDATGSEDEVYERVRPIFQAYMSELSK